MSALSLSSIEKGSSTPGVYPWAYCNADHDIYNRPCETTWASHYPSCDDMKQSPINFVSTTAAANTQGSITLSSSVCSSVKIISGPDSGNGWTVDMNTCKASANNVPAGTSYVTFQGVDYYLIQFHFHSPSEHTLNGKTYAMDAHFVHSSLDGALLVVGVFADAESNTDNAFLNKFWPTGFAADSVLNTTVMPYWFLPDDKSLYHYSGSFTTPPCTEGIKWFHFANNVSMSAAQLASFKTALSSLNQTAAVGRNNRVPQSLNNRAVYKFQSSDVNVIEGLAPSSSPQPSPSNPSGHGSPGIAAFTPIGIIILLIIILWERWCDRSSAGGESRWKAGSAVTPEAVREAPLQVSSTLV